MDQAYLKRIGFTLATLWSLWSLPLLDILTGLDLKPLWIAFIEGGWATLSAMIWWVLAYYFGVKKEEVQAALAKLEELLGGEEKPTPEADIPIPVVNEEHGAQEG